MIGPYSISPFVNNRQLNTACGLGNHDTQNTFLISSYTSGDPSTVGLCVQGAGGADLDSGAPVDTMQLWLNFLRSSLNFTIDVPLLTINNNVEMTGTITTTDVGIYRKTTIQPAGIEVRDTENDPFGDPILVGIIPSGITMQNGNASNQISSMTTSAINFTNTDSGFINDINVSSMTVQDTAGSYIGTVSNTIFSLYDNVLNLSNIIDASSITSTNWSITTLGQGIFSSLYISSWTTITNVGIGGGGILTLNFNSQQNKTFNVSMSQNITSLVLTGHITNSIYKVYLTVQATGPYTFTKPVGGNIYSNLGGNTSMSANSTWLIRMTVAGTKLLCEFINMT